MIKQNSYEYLEIAQILKNKEIVAIPTDGVWGLFCLKNNQDGINKIYELKQRNWNKKLAIYSNNLNFISRNIGMTYIKDNQAYRAGDVHPMLKKIIEITGDLVGTSCNLSNTIPITNKTFIPFDISILNDECFHGIESTIYSLDSNSIIRSGYCNFNNEINPVFKLGEYFLEITNDISYDLSYKCEDLCKNFWYWVAKNKSINFNIQCQCYTCKLIKKYIENIKYNSLQ